MMRATRCPVPARRRKGRLRLKLRSLTPDINNRKERVCQRLVRAWCSDPRPEKTTRPQTRSTPAPRQMFALGDSEPAPGATFVIPASPHAHAHATPPPTPARAQRYATTQAGAPDGYGHAARTPTPRLPTVRRPSLSVRAAPSSHARRSHAAQGAADVPSVVFCRRRAPLPDSQPSLLLHGRRTFE